MIGIVIVAHFGLSEQYLTTVEHVVGKQAGIVPISISPDDNRKQKEHEICRAAATVDTGNGVVIVTDIFGVKSAPASVAVRRSTLKIPAIEIESPALVYVRSLGKVVLPARATLAPCYVVYLYRRYTLHYITLRYIHNHIYIYNIYS